MKVVNALDIKDIEYSYNGTENVLENISFSVEKGEYVGLIGNNGSAKSTLFKIILGLIECKKGVVNIRGSIGYLPQHLKSFNRRFPATVEEIVASNFKKNGKIGMFLKKQDRDKVLETLDKVEMTDFRKRLIGELSGGQQQRVFIARLLINNPEVIFMDEPFVGVDNRTQEHIYNIIQKINKEYNTTIFMATHDIPKIFSNADKIIYLNDKKAKEMILKGKNKLERTELGRKYIEQVI